jgi:hypothetical protein
VLSFKSKLAPPHRSFHTAVSWFTCRLPGSPLIRHLDYPP